MAWLPNKIESASSRTLIVAGSFEPDGTNNPTNVKGHGFTVTRNGAVGEFEVALDHPINEYISIVVSVTRAASSTDTNVVWAADQVTGASPTFDIVYVDTADSSTTDFAQVDLDATTDRINFVAYCAVGTGEGTGA